MNKITKAIIPVAGYGTRRLPITKAVEKCMLPVGNRPVVDYVVEDCMKAGITDIIFVVSEQFEQLRGYYGRKQLLEEYLRDKGKTKELQEVIDLAGKATFHYIVQDQHQPYGTTVPVSLCKSLIEPGEHFLYISGDQFYFHQDGSSEAAHFLHQAKGAGTDTAMLAVEVPHEEVYKYGIVKTKVVNGVELYETVVEKPKVEEAPTNLNNGTFWLLNDKVFPYVAKDLKRPRDGEYYITDVVNDFVADGNTVAVVRAKGEYSDCGAVETWLQTNIRVLAK